MFGSKREAWRRAIKQIGIIVDFSQLITSAVGICEAVCVVCGNHSIENYRICDRVRRASLKPAAGRSVIISAYTAILSDQRRIYSQVVIADQPYVYIVLSNQSNDISAAMIGILQVIIYGDASPG